MSRLLQMIASGGQDRHDEFSRLHTEIDRIRHICESNRKVTQMIARRRTPRRAIRVVFLVHNPDAWYSLHGVYQAMTVDPEFEPLVATLNKNFAGSGSQAVEGEERAHRVLKSFGVPHMRFASHDPWQDQEWLMRLDPDIIFRQSQWEGDVPAPYTTPELRFARLALVPYEVMNLVRNPNADGHNSAVDDPFHKSAWAVFCVHERWLSYARAEAPATLAGQFLATGHPKVQMITERLEALGDRRTGVFTVLWSPHHSIEADWIRFGTLPWSGPVMSDLARAHPDWRFVLSPHPALEHKIAGTPLAEILDAWDRLPNTERIAGDGDYVNAFAASDVLVSDGVSWLMEYQLTGKPVVFIENAEHRPFNDFGELVRAGTNVVHDARDLRARIEEFAAGADDPAAEGQAQVRALLSEHPDAVHAILAAIKDRLREEGWMPEG